jgi:hypothetical protein
LKVFDSKSVQSSGDEYSSRDVDDRGVPITDNKKKMVRRGNFASDSWAAEMTHDSIFAASVPTMEKLLKFTGLERVKMAVIDLYRRIALGRQRGSIGDDIPLNFRFVGNPGTGMSYYCGIAFCLKITD